MKPMRDPERAELNHLSKVCPLGGKRVLEIGCGDGAFIRQYAHQALRTVGIDPVESDVQKAIKTIRFNRTWFLLGEGENLPFPTRAFDIVLFASSL